MSSQDLNLNNSIYLNNNPVPENQSHKPISFPAMEAQVQSLPTSKRSRAGTLPSRLYQSPFQSINSNPNQMSSHNLNSSSSTLNSNVSPAFNAVKEESTPFTSSVTSSIDPFGGTLSQSATGTQAPTPVSNSSNGRLRSGSLYSNNSIWNDNSNNIGIPINNYNTSPTKSFFELSNTHSNINDLSLSNDLNLNDSLITNPFELSRNRSYTTNQIKPLGNDFLKGFGVINEYQEQSFSPNVNSTIHSSQLQTQIPTSQIQPIPQSNQTSSFNTDIDNRIFETLSNHRHRSQTYSGGDQSLSSKNSILQTILQDDLDPTTINYISNFENPTLSPTSLLVIDNIPPNILSLNLYSLVGSLIHNGEILSIRVIRGGKANLCLMEFDSIELAMNVKASLTHYEFFPGYVCYVAFGKLLSSTSSNLAPVNIASTLPNNIAIPNTNGLSVAPSNINHQQVSPKPINNDTTFQEVIDFNRNSNVVTTANFVPPKLSEISVDMMDIISKFEVSESSSISKIQSLLDKSLSYNSYESNFGPLPDPLTNKDFDAPRLREIRKQIDSNSLSKSELEELALNMLDELPELSSDYLGNTVVQKLFENSDPVIKIMMLKQVAAYITQMGVHKNGTWAAQKMIAVADTPIEKKIISENLHPYAKPLFNDQFGNYVLQCCLRFGTPYNDFIFQTILSNFIEISQGRFGARAIRAVLESQESTKEQIAILAAMIVMNAEYLISNSNGALLITWFLDTCQLPNRHSILAPRLIPNLFELCTHKLADLTILKVLNNRSEPQAKDLILNELFGSFNELMPEESAQQPTTQLLEKVLNDQANGPTFIYKILSCPLLEAPYRQFVIQQVRRILIELNVSNFQNYKKLMDEVGLVNRSENFRNGHHQRSSSNGTSRRKFNKQMPLSNQSTINQNLNLNNNYYRNNNQANVYFNAQQQIYGNPTNMGIPPHFLQNGGNFNNIQNQNQTQTQAQAQSAIQPPPSSQQQQQSFFQGNPNAIMQQYPMNTNNAPSQTQSFDLAVMQQLEQLSLSSAAMGYSVPGSPSFSANQIHNQPNSQQAAYYGDASGGQNGNW